MSFKYQLKVNDRQYQGQSSEWLNILCIILLCGGLAYGGLWCGTKLAEKWIGDRPIVGIEL